VKAFSSFATGAIGEDAVQVAGGTPGWPVPGQRNRSAARLSVQIGWAPLIALSPS
jgi:hypothetical protein